MKTASANEMLYTSYGTAQNDRFFRNRLRSFGISMIVMGISFVFYYLGLFGTVEGPLNPDRIGMTLAGMGVEKWHVVFFFIGLEAAL